MFDFRQHISLWQKNDWLLSTYFCNIAHTIVVRGTFYELIFFDLHYHGVSRAPSLFFATTATRVLFVIIDGFVFVSSASVSLDVFASRRTVSYTYFFDPHHHDCVLVSLDVFPYSFDLSWYMLVISKLLFLFVLQVRVFLSMLWFSRWFGWLRSFVDF